MPIPFGPKTAWIAVADVTPEALAAALGITALEPADWIDGIDLAYEHGDDDWGVGVFITPALGRWTLAVGQPLFIEREGFAAELSRTLEGREVQHFATHRVADGHIWARAIDGRTVRHVLAADGEMFETGEPTSEELACGFRRMSAEDEPADDDDVWFADEDFVLELAGAWSLNPLSIDDDYTLIGPGHFGRMSKPAAWRGPDPRWLATRIPVPPPEAEDLVRLAPPPAPPQRSWLDALLRGFRK